MIETLINIGNYWIDKVDKEVIDGKCIETIYYRVCYIDHVVSKFSNLEHAINDFYNRTSRELRRVGL